MPNSSDQSRLVPSGVKVPYVGLRPYEREERAIFFGRETDTLFLCDKIFSARLTLLYAESGVGKSSLLRTLVMPRLEAEHAWPVYFDGWSADDPSLLLRDKLVNLASKIGLPDAGAGAPTLVELVRLVASADGRTVVLILDQFEAFLSKHGQALDPFKKDLASLVRTPGLDVRVVLSLRHEFLAALEPFRGDILNLFQSTYLLDYLDSPGIREAIERPAQLFGARYEPDLIEKLIQDLSAQEVGESLLTGKRPVDLPMMQIVCSQLWNAAKENGQTTLTCALYEQLGGATAILDRYVRTVMPQAWDDQQLTARLMKYLAPPSGLKRAFYADELAQNETLNESRVREVLESLSNVVLRTREFRGKRTYELRHDAWARVLAPWREAVRVQERKRRYVKRGFFFAVSTIVLASIIGVSLWLEDRHELRRNTEEPLAELRGMGDNERAMQAENRFDSVAGYLLWRRTGAKRLDLLRDLLERYSKYHPADYGVNSSGVEFITLPQRDEGWPLELQYSAARALDESYFIQAWQGVAKFFAEDWGLLVPLRVAFQKDDRLPKRLLRLKAPGDRTLELNLPEYEREAFITSKDLVQPAQEFFTRFQTNWTLLEAVTNGGPWWLVPRWSLPAWKVTGQLATDGSGASAWLLMLALLNRPEMMLDTNSVELLLCRVIELYPETVKEARAAQGDRLPQDLAELVKLGQPLTALPTTMDALAQYSGDWPSNVATALDESWTKPDADLPVHLHGPWSSPLGSQAPEEQKSINGKADEISKSEVPNQVRQPPSERHEKSGAQIPDAYRDVVRWLPKVEPAIRTYISKEVEKAWWQGEQRTPEFEETLELFQDEFARRFGFDVPEVRFRNASWEPKLPANALRIEMLNQDASYPQAQAFSPLPDSVLHEFIDALRFRAREFRVHWITAETAQRWQDHMDSALQDWLKQKYSLTDLKLLLRAIVNPSAEELKAYTRLSVNDGNKVEIAPEDTLRHLEWCLRSLVFWGQVTDLLDLSQISDYLRATQRARLRPEAGVEAGQSVVGQIVDGIQELQAGRIPQAETNFLRAIQKDRAAAIRCFLTGYPQTLRSNLISRYESAWKNPKVKLDRIERLDLEDLIAELEPTAGRETLRCLKLGLLASYPQSPRERKNTLKVELMQRYGLPDEWPAKQASVPALIILQEFDPLHDKLELRENAEVFLKSAIRRLDSEEVCEAFDKVIDLVRETGPHNWCWKLLGELADLCGDARPTLKLAEQLLDSELQADLTNVISLAAEAERRTKGNSELSSEEQSRRLDRAHFARADAMEKLTVLHGIDYSSEADQSLQSLLKSQAVGEQAMVQLLELQLAEGRYSDAARLLSSLNQGQDDPDLVLQKFWVELLEGNTNAASNIADHALRMAPEDEDGEENPAMLYVAALGQLLTMTGNWEETSRRFLVTDHEYVPYIAMMLYDRLATGSQKAEAHAVIEGRWKKSDSSNWRDRLRQGDESAWREMLIGYYLRKVERDTIFGPLENDVEFATSDLHYLHLARRSMLCEAYFYDALKAEAENDKVGRDKSLQKVIDTKQRSYFEYKMAQFLLGLAPEAR